MSFLRVNKDFCSTVYFYDFFYQTEKFFNFGNFFQIESWEK